MQREFVFRTYGNLFIILPPFYCAEQIVIEVEVKRNSTSIEWDEKLSEKKSKEFKEMSLVVRNQLRKVLERLQVISEIKVKKFKENEGNTFCEIECKVNSQQVTEKDIENALNATIDIGAALEISYSRVNMTLNLPGLSWVDAYNDHNSSEYKNLTTAIKTALSEVFKDTDDVVSFEIVLVSEAPDGSLVVEYHVLVDPESALEKKDLEETLMEFTKDDSFEKMITGVKKQQEKEDIGGEEGEDESDKAPVGLIVFAAVIMCLVIITFVVVVSGCM